MTPRPVDPDPLLVDLCTLVGADENTTTGIHVEDIEQDEVRIRWEGTTSVSRAEYDALVARHRTIPPVDLDVVDRIAAQLARDRQASPYWRQRPDDLAAVETYLESLRDHLGKP